MREYRDSLDAAHARIAQLEGAGDPAEELVGLRREVRELRSAIARERASRRVWVVCALTFLAMIGAHVLHSEVERRREVRRTWERLGGGHVATSPPRRHLHF